MEEFMEIDGDNYFLSEWTTFLSKAQADEKKLICKNFTGLVNSI